jgi:hypothetical protein
LTMLRTLGVLLVRRILFLVFTSNSSAITWVASLSAFTYIGFFLGLWLTDDVETTLGDLSLQQLFSKTFFYFVLFWA